MRSIVENFGAIMSLWSFFPTPRKHANGAVSNRNVRHDIGPMTHFQRSESEEVHLRDVCAASMSAS